VRFLSAQGLEDRPVRGPAKARAHELVAFEVPATAPGDPTAVELRQGFRNALQRADRRFHEQHEAHERRDRVAGQAEDQRPLADAERNRLAGLDGHAPEDFLDSELGLDPTDEIVRPHGDTAGSDDDVGAERVLEGASMRDLVVADGLHQLDDRTGGLELGRQDQPVRLIDLARGERFARTAQLGSRWQNGGARPACAPNLWNPGGPQGPEPRGCEHRARLDDALARLDVAAARPDVVAALHGDVDFDLVVMLDNILDRHDGIGAVGDDPAGGNSHCLSRLERRACGLAGRNPRVDAKASRRVGSPDGVTVHRGARERRQIDLRPGRLSEDAAGRVFKRHGLGRERPGAREDQALRFGKREQIRHASRIS